MSPVSHAVLDSEEDRIRTEFERRAREIPADLYSLLKPANLFIYQERVRSCLSEIQRAGLPPLEGARILEVGCGEGQWLVDFETWGAMRSNLAGIDLDEERTLGAQSRLGPRIQADGTIDEIGAEIRVGNAAQLPWRDRTFDIVLQSTVFSSILDEEMRHQVAREMVRVLRPGGAIIWYDFIFNNPANPAVRGVAAREIDVYFPTLRRRLKRSTLAPPLVRWLAPRSWLCASLAETIPILRAYYLGIFRKAR